MFVFPRPTLLLPAATAGAVVTTWNPADTTSNVVISNGNHVATMSAGNTGARGLVGVGTAGDKTVEFTITARTGATVIVGLMPLAASLSTWTTNAYVYRDNGQIWAGGANATGNPTLNVGDRVQLRRVGTDLHFYRNGSAVSSYSFITSADLYPYVFVDGGVTSAVVTLTNTEALPSGSALWP